MSALPFSLQKLGGMKMIVIGYWLWVIGYS